MLTVEILIWNHEIDPIFNILVKFGDSDVSDIVMLVTDLRCWWQNHYVGGFSFRLMINR